MVERGRDQSRVRTWPETGGRAGYIPGDLAEYVARFRELARRTVAAEAARQQLLPWIAIAFGIGVAVYFAAPREPVVWVVAPVATLAWIVAVALRRSRAFAALALAAALMSGFAVATIKTARIAHPILGEPVMFVTLTGFVEIREERERTDRFVLRVDKFETTRAGEAGRVERVRLSVKKGTAPFVGTYVELKARLSPPFSATRPGGYDFARDIYFQRIGASGFVLGAIKPLAAPAHGGWWLGYAAMISGMRDAIDARIRQSLSGDTRAIASALLTGKRDAISSDVNDAMYVSGLGHVLSISGYHMAIVAGAVFFAVRGLLALFPGLVAGAPIKKWAALAALGAAAFYLLLSGAEVATQRSFLMTAVVLVGVMVDRRAITFRTLAVAALAVLIVAPEVVVHPGFQMSFAATLALVALVEGGAPVLLGRPDHSAVGRAALWGGREIMVLALASLVAGLATMPYAAFHFHRAAPFGVLANLAAMPVVSFWVMPSGLLGLVAIPFGFDGVFWRLMEFGIGWMIFIAGWVAALPGAVGRVPSFGMGPLLLATAGLITMALLKTRLRWTGGLAVALAAGMALSTRQPDIRIASDGASVAVRGSDGLLHFMHAKADAFVIKDWLTADGDGRKASDPSLTKGMRCDPDGCTMPLRDSRLVALTLKPEAFADDCEKATVIVTRLRPPKHCAAMVFDTGRLDATGSVSLTERGGRLALTAVKPDGSDRPWARNTRHPQPAPWGDSFLAPSGTPRPVDATPLPADLSPDDQ